MPRTKLSLGAVASKDGSDFLLWAPLHDKVALHFVWPEERIIPMTEGASGYFQTNVKNAAPGWRYFYQLDDAAERPDPASRFQPQGVHGASEIAKSDFAWEDEGWKGMALHDYVFYEIHVGAFTPGGTFDEIVPRLSDLRDLGITAIELMPIAQFSGERNWGYDGVYPFSAQNSYGGPEGLKRLVNACHKFGMAVALDVVYNHLGPEGNYLSEFAPYFTERYKTPWGRALNFDGPHSDEVRRFFVESALYWMVECHVDVLRLDALHAILDNSATPFIEELAQTIHKAATRLGRRVHLIAESTLNNPRLLYQASRGGLGLDAQWNDDFHHALHVLLTGERFGYYQDFSKTSDLAKAFSKGYVHTGEYSSFRKRKLGRSSRGLNAGQFVVYSQNHDQVGNRLGGERLTTLVPFEALKLAAGVVILSPFVPLLFMGEEYGEMAPFPYFVSHSNPDLAEAVRKGRKEEFEAFFPSGEFPDEQDKSTFLLAKLNPALKNEGRHKMLFEFYRRLFELRRTIPALSLLEMKSLKTISFEEEKTLYLERLHEQGMAVVLFHFENRTRGLNLPVLAGRWEKLLDSTEPKWGGDGSNIPVSLLAEGEITVQLPPWSCFLFLRESPRF